MRLNKDIKTVVDSSFAGCGVSKRIQAGEGVAELKFWNFNVPYKAYMALTNVKTLQLWKFCNTLALVVSPTIIGGVKWEPI